MRITEHFTIGELVKSATAERLGIDNTPNDGQTQNLIDLAVWVLEPARQEAGQPFVITSGYRSPDVNKAVGGARNSYHLLGRAADIYCHSLKQAYAIARILLKQPATDLAIVEKKNGNIWVHVQTSTKPRNVLLTLIQ